jgi:hypothetical protein
MTLSDYEDVKECSAECMFDRKCIQRTSMGAILELKREFWGTKSQPAPLPKERKEKITNIFTLFQPFKYPVGTVSAINVRFFHTTYCF